MTTLRRLVALATLALALCACSPAMCARYRIGTAIRATEGAQRVQRGSTATTLPVVHRCPRQLVQTVPCKHSTLPNRTVHP